MSCLKVLLFLGFVPTEQLCHNLPQSEETAHVILTAPCCLILCFINCLLIV